MKKNSGFVLFETLVVSTLVLGTLIFLFIQIYSIKDSYEISFKYDTVPGLYKAKIFSNYLINTDYSNAIEPLNNAEYNYLDVTDCTYFTSMCYDLKNKIEAKTIFLTKNDISNLKVNINSLQISNTFKRYIRRLKDTTDDENYRIIIEFNDDTYASVSLINTTDKTKYELRNLLSNSGFEDNTITYNNGEYDINLKKSGLNSFKLNLQTDHVSLQHNGVNITNTHKYYISQNVYSKINITNFTTDTSGINGLYGFESANMTQALNENIEENKWTKQSAILTANKNSSNSKYVFKINNISNAINIDDILVIDLTATFGSGNEPDLSWCDANLKYFEDTIYIYK